MRKQCTAKQKTQIVLEIPKEDRPIAQIATQYGIHPNQLYKWKAQALEGLPGLFEDGRKTGKDLKAAHEQQIEELYAQIGRLNTQLAWLKNHLASTLSRDERYQLIERENAEQSLSSQASF